MKLPDNLGLPLFVYGALKPGMPAYAQVSALVAESIEDEVEGELYVRDGLPLLRPRAGGSVQGVRLLWMPGREEAAYRIVCDFEPSKHYQWAKATLRSGIQANILLIRYPDRGNPQPVHTSYWNLMDDPAFGSGLDAVAEMIREIEADTRIDSDADWRRFFRSQMAYLLLWSILERLSALSFGPALDPMARVNKLAELPGMSQLVHVHVTRSDTVSDSRNPKRNYELSSSDPRECFAYYYQIRSNLSHRGKGLVNEFFKVHDSLKELLAITQKYLGGLRGSTVGSNNSTIVP